jgi:hypothetical protein
MIDSKCQSVKRKLIGGEWYRLLLIDCFFRDQTPNVGLFRLFREPLAWHFSSIVYGIHWHAKNMGKKWKIISLADCHTSHSWKRINCFQISDIWKGRSIAVLLASAMQNGKWVATRVQKVRVSLFPKSGRRIYDSDTKPQKKSQPAHILFYRTIHPFCIIWIVLYTTKTLLSQRSQSGLLQIFQASSRILANMKRTAFSAPSPSSSWIPPFLLGASATLSIIWLSQRWKRSTSASLKTKSERKPSAHTIGKDVLDHEQLSNRMLRKAEAVIQWRTSRLILVVERCTNGQ